MENNATQFQHIPASEMREVFRSVLLALNFSNDDASVCADVFTQNSLEGVYTHGVNRFPRFVEYIRGGYVKPGVKPVLKNSAGNIEQWDGELGPGIINAIHATDRAMALAKESGIGCVTLANTNHWMRGGSYGWQAAKQGFVFLGWTNTIANMPAWGAVDARLGNNPLVVAIPFRGEAIVLDMAMSQFSFGSMEKAALQKEQLPVPGGFNKQNKITHDPAEIIDSGRPLPVGYWKGAGLALLLDILATILSGGKSTAGISAEKIEYGLSQVFVAIDISRLHQASAIPQAVQQIIDDYHRSMPAEEKGKILYPGERVLKDRAKNSAEGIPVLKKIWDEILSFQS